MKAEVMMKEYKNMKKELTVTEFQLRQFQGSERTGHDRFHALFPSGRGKGADEYSFR